MGTLQIPIGTYHRSQTGKERSIVLNQATREILSDPKKVFLPVSLSSKKQLRIARETNPVYWIGKEYKIKRITIVSKDSSLKKKVISMISI